MGAAKAMPEPVVVANIEEWRAWLITNEETSDGIWLLLAKKGVSSPTSLRYQEALEEALCGGWIDGQARSVDEHTYVQRFTPRRTRSLWSKRNVGIVGRLAEEGRLRPRGVAEIERAQQDGRWDRAYAGPATATVPPELAAALDAAPEAKTVFDSLTGMDRYSALHPVLTATSPATLQRRIDRLIGELKERDTPSG